VNVAGHKKKSILPFISLFILEKNWFGVFSVGVLFCFVFFFLNDDVEFCEM